MKNLSFNDKTVDVMLPLAFIINAIWAMFTKMWKSEDFSADFARQENMSLITLVYWPSILKTLSF